MIRAGKGVQNGEADGVLAVPTCQFSVLEPVPRGS